MDQLLGVILIAVPLGLAVASVVNGRREGAAATVRPLAVARIAFALIGGGTLAAMGIALARGGGTSTPDLASSLGASAVGGLSCVLVALGELQPAAMGMRHARRPWWVVGSVAPVLFTVLGTGWMALLADLDAGLVAEQQLLQQIAAAPPLLALLAAVYAVLGAPLAEEVLFRGALHEICAAKWRGAWGSLATGVLFGVLHLADPIAVPPLILMGVALGELRRRSGSLWPCVLAHAGNNVLAVALALA